MIPLILSSLRKWKQDEELCADALGALRALVLENQESEKQVVEHFQDVMDVIEFHMIKDRESYQIGDRVMAKWKDGKEKGFRDEYPATVVGLHQSSGIGQYLLSNSFSSSSCPKYHLCFDDSYEDKHVAYYNIRSQSEDEQKRHVQPASHKETCEKNRRRGRKKETDKLKKNSDEEDEEGKLVCLKAHKLVRHVQTPSTYASGSVLCDVCGKNDLVRSCTYFSHCTHCKYDLCDECSETVSNAYPSSSSSIDFEKRIGMKHRFFKWVTLLFNAVSFSRVKEKGTIIEALSVAAARAAARRHPASRVFSLSVDFQKNLELIVQQGRLFLRQFVRDSATRKVGRILFPRLTTGSTNKMNEMREMRHAVHSPKSTSTSSSKANEKTTYTQNRLFRKACSVVGSFGPRHFANEEKSRLQENLSKKSFFAFNTNKQTNTRAPTSKHENTLDTLLVDTDESSKTWNLLAAIKTVLAIQYARCCVWNIFCCKERKKGDMVKKENVKALLKLSLRSTGKGLNDVNSSVETIFDMPIDFFREDSLTRMIAESQNQRTS